MGSFGESAWLNYEGTSLSPAQRGAFRHRPPTLGSSSSWQSLSPGVAGNVLKSMQWDVEVSILFRLVCKAWKFAHDESLQTLSACFVHTDLCMPRYGRIPDQVHTLFPALATLVTLESTDQGMRSICGFTKLTDLTVFLRFGYLSR
jgi:hypothetical protein